MKYEPGTMLTFKADADRKRYGYTAVIEGTILAQSRPAGQITRWLDIVTANGTEVSWTPSMVASKTRLTEDGVEYAEREMARRVDG